MAKVRLEIVIEVDANDTDLFAVGPEDLRNHFIPQWMNVKTEDVLKCSLYKIQSDGYYSHYHNDNFIDDSEKIPFNK